MGLAGAGAAQLAAGLTGTWLVHDRSGGLQVVVVALRHAGAAETAGAPLGPIRRIVFPDGSVADPATGWVGRGEDDAAAWGRALLRQVGARLAGC
jgi:hypothetical protein